MAQLLAQGFKRLIQRRRLTTKFRYHNKLVCLRPPPLSVFPVTLLSKFPHRIQALSLLQTHSLLKSRTCNRPSLPPKGPKIIDASIPLSYHFSVKTHQNWDFNLLVRLIPKYDLQRQSFTNTVIQP